MRDHYNKRRSREREPGLEAIRMQGIFLATDRGTVERPKSKKAIREAAAADPTSVLVEATSIFGNEFQGGAHLAPEGRPIYFVGPDPYEKRSFYGTLTRKGDKVVVK